MGEIRSKTCEQGKDRRDQLALSCVGLLDLVSGRADGTRCVPDELTQFPPKAGYKFHPQVVPRVAITSEMGYDGEVRFLD